MKRINVSVTFLLTEDVEDDNVDAVDYIETMLANDSRFNADYIDDIEYDVQSLGN